MKLKPNQERWGRFKDAACPTCGGIRNVTNKQCAKCYMREYRAKQRRMRLRRAA